MSSDLPFSALLALKPIAGDALVITLMKCWDVCSLSSDLQNVKDELHYDRLSSLPVAPAVYDGSHHTTQSIEVLSWEGLSITPGHKSLLKIQETKNYFDIHTQSSLDCLVKLWESRFPSVLNVTIF